MIYSKGMNYAGVEAIRSLKQKVEQARTRADGPFDVKIRATEQTHQAVLSGEMDADAAFFTGKVRILGSVLTAFRVKNRFLSFLQRHLTDKPGDNMRYISTH